MRTATGLALLAVGAILAFAVNADIPGFNLAVAGWILMLTGAAGMFIPARASGWLRRRVVLTSPPGRAGRPQGPPVSPHPVASPRSPAVKQLESGPYPPRIMRDPAALAAKILRDAQIVPGDSRPPAPGDRPIEAEVVEEDIAAGAAEDGITLRELFDDPRDRPASTA
jgi:Domain of unknown function (DUF6458)